MSYSSSPQNQTKASRIHTDIERVKEITSRIESSTDRIVRHAHTLGYFEPPKDERQTAALTPISSSLDDALQQLDRAVGNLSGALNLFE